MAPSIQRKISPLSPLQQYAKDVSAAADILTAFCIEQGLPQPSFGAQAPSVTIPYSAPAEVQDARQQLISSAADLQKLATEPAEFLQNQAIHYQHLSCLRWLVEFEIFKHTPCGESISYEKLANNAKVPEFQLRSVTRMAMTSNLLCEPTPGHVSHNAVSALFVKDWKQLEWANFMTTVSMPAAAGFAEATRRWGADDEQNHVAFCVGMKTEKWPFEYWAQSKELSDRFARYMTSVQSSHSTSLEHLVNGFDWARLGAGVVVDVGGSTCSSTIALANAFPELTLVTEDLPDTIANATKLLSAQPQSISRRISAQAYNFFTPQPIQDGDIYLFRMIMHDWKNAECVAILRNQLKSLKAKPSARVLIMDTVLPPPGSISSVEEAILRVRDLAMIQSFNSTERDLTEFEELFRESKDEDGSLVLQNVIRPAGSVMSVLEVAYERFGECSIAKEHASEADGLYVNGDSVVVNASTKVV
ncbi:putative O-methyltransferase [Viridothelium virens]|uniref:Putative O-methyltransferase n=1 Tax=Viridothelium virens TaxID=1048519 RepID=A0A6A6GWI7_VIRVR|nr:putative O-methyltransferase [Viridothelium virens]